MTAEAPLAPAARALRADRFVAEDHDDLAVEIARLGEAVVAVRPVLDAVAHEGERTRDLAAARVRQQPEVGAFLERFAVGGDRCEDDFRSPRRQDERLAIAARERRREPVSPHPVLEVVRGPFDSRRARRAALEVGVRERHHVLVPRHRVGTERLERVAEGEPRRVDLDEGLLRREAVDVDRAFDDPLGGRGGTALLRQGGR